MIRVLVDAAALRAGGELDVTGDEHTYLTRARRVVRGDAVEVFDGHGAVAAATVVLVDGARARLAIGEVRREAQRGPTVAALLPLIKGDRMDACLEKLVEVGVDEIVLYEATRAVVRLEPAKVADRLRRWQAVLLAGARQAGRAAPPTITAPVPLGAALASLPAGGYRVVADPTASAPPRWPPAPVARVVVLTGPEGGLAPEELTAAQGAGFAAVSLGDLVLRADTAPVVAVAHLRLLGRAAPGA